MTIRELCSYAIINNLMEERVEDVLSIINRERNLQEGLLCSLGKKEESIINPVNNAGTLDDSPSTFQFKEYSYDDVMDLFNS